VGQVNLQSSFGTADFRQVWPALSRYLDILSIEAGDAKSVYDYTWTDPDYYTQQIERLKPGYDYSSSRG
jgi:hypothetical protein